MELKIETRKLGELGTAFLLWQGNEILIACTTLERFAQRLNEFIKNLRQ